MEVILYRERENFIFVDRFLKISRMLACDSTVRYAINKTQTLNTQLNL